VAAAAVAAVAAEEGADKTFAIANH
jgi:hypothetical protein